jgi:hypothetical protein
MSKSISLWEKIKRIIAHSFELETRAEVEERLRAEEEAKRREEEKIKRIAYHNQLLLEYSDGIKAWEKEREEQLRLEKAEREREERIRLYRENRKAQNKVVFREPTKQDIEE